MTHRGPGPVVAALSLGGIHALVDAASVFILFRDLPASSATPLAAAGWIVAYDILAFALQAPLGWLADRVADRQRGYRLVALTGVALVGLALPLALPLPRGAALVAGLGNALFHVGAGAVVLRGSAARAREAGLFVGPGVLGLTAGIFLGRSTSACRPGLLLLCLAALAVGSWALRLRAQAPAPLPLSPSRRTVQAALGLLLLTVVLRALIGDTLSAYWRAESTHVIVALALAACCGKLLGGETADRCGWVRTAVVALVAAAAAMAGALVHPGAAFAAMLLLQTTMPLTLKAVHLALPDRPGLAFGLPSLALLVGSLPGLLGVWPLTSGPQLAWATGLSAIVIVLGLSPEAIRCPASGLLRAMVTHRARNDG